MASKREFNLIVFVRVKFRLVKKWVNVIYHIKATFDYIYLKLKGVDTKYGYVVLKGLPKIYKAPGSTIKISKGVTLVSSNKYNPTGICHPVILTTLNSNAVIIIGQDSGMSGATICASKSITLGEYVALGSNVSIFDTDFHAINPIDRRYNNAKKTKNASVKIGDNAWIGANSTILKGVVINNCAVIGASSLVTRDVKENSLYAGNPAKFIRMV